MKRAMKQILKSVLIKIKFIQRKRYLKNINDLKKYKIIYYEKNKVKQLVKMIDKIDIKIDPHCKLQHWISEDVLVINPNPLIGNMPPNYSKILDYSINDLIIVEKDDDMIILLNKIKEYISKIVSELKNYENQNENIEQSIQLFENMLGKKALSLDDAFQRILFWSSLFWQSGHQLVGLGRLDVLLKEYEDQYSKEETVSLIQEFLKKLHDYYEFKSASLLGDIGQIIILGGLNEDENYFSNKLTYYFIEAVKRCQYTDPKILLRVSNNTPKELIKLAVECVATGVGSPLFSNDEIVIPCLKEFGYENRDAYNYVTSACWEPVSYGNSLEQNNLANINFANVFVEMMKDENIMTSDSFESVMCNYKKHLSNEIKKTLDYISIIRWEQDPLYTFFTEGSSNDIAYGGAKYNDYGILSVGMSNAINSLMNIKKMVFLEKKISLKELHEIWIKSTDDELKKLNLSTEYYGHDDNETISLTNEVLKNVKKGIEHYRNPFGGKVKFGLSSPGYINEGNKTGLTFDNRVSKAPLGVHISASDNVAYTELISFASHLKYGGYGSNGNVVDYFVAPNFIEDNLQKFIQFVILSIKQGFFQMQMNVVGSKTLLDAKKNPSKYPDLIVRVWGFSAYFKDLPEDYKNLLIERAILSENIN